MKINGRLFAIAATGFGIVALAGPAGAAVGGATASAGATTVRNAVAAVATASTTGTVHSVTGASSSSTRTSSASAQTEASAPQTSSAADHNSGSSTQGCGGDLSVTATPTTLWPPDHKMVPVTFSLTESPSDNDGGTLSIQIMSIATNQVDEDGAGQPTLQQGPDWSPSAPGTAQTATEPGPATVTEMFRAERNGQDPLKTGRQYSVMVACKETNQLGVTETMGSATFTITVPHDHSDF